MAALPYMQLYVADYLADTAHLNAAQHGAYMLLLMNYWQRGKPLKNDNERLANVARMSNDEWTSNRELLAEFFDVTDDEWVHHRIERDLAAVAAKSNKASASGKASAKRRLNERSTNAQRSLNHTEADTDTNNKLAAREEDASQMHRLNRILNFDETDFMKHVANIQTLVRLKAEGCDFDSHILPAAESAAKSGRARALSYISPKARELRDAKAIAASLPTPFEDTDWQGWKDRLRGFRERGSWLAKWGPKPGETGCKVPNEILEEQAA